MYKLENIKPGDRVVVASLHGGANMSGVVTGTDPEGAHGQPTIDFTLLYAGEADAEFPNRWAYVRQVIAVVTV